MTGSTSIRDILRQYLEVGAGDNALCRQQLQPYVDAGMSAIKVLYRKEFVKGATEPHYYVLDLDKGLSANLARKIVVEFPELTVVCPDNIGQYKIVHDSIEEVDTTSTSDIVAGDHKMDVVDIDSSTITTLAGKSQ